MEPKTEEEELVSVKANSPNPSEPENSINVEILRAIGHLAEQIKGIDSRTSNLERSLNDQFLNEANNSKARIPVERIPTNAPDRRYERFSAGAGEVENEYVEELKRERFRVPDESQYMDPSLFKSKADPFVQFNRNVVGGRSSLANYMNREDFVNSSNVNANANAYQQQFRYSVTKEWVECKIYLEKLTPFAILDWMEKLTKFENTHDQVIVKAGALLNDYARSVVIQKTDFVGDYRKFFPLSKEEVYSLLQETVRPTSQLDFHDKLKSTLFKKFPWDPSVKITIFNYRSFHLRLKEYCDKFAEAYLFLSYGCLKDNIPPIDNKEKGLMKVFIGGMPGKLPGTIAEECRLRKCTNLSLMVKKFLEESERINKLSEMIKDVKVFFTDKESSKDSDGDIVEKGLFKSKSYREIDRSRSQRVNAITEDVFMDQSCIKKDDSEDDGSFEEMNDQIDLARDDAMTLEELDSNKDGMNEDTECETGEPVNMVSNFQPRGIAPTSQPYAQRSATAQVQRMSSGNPNSASNPPRACYGMLENGVCNKEGGCTFSHDFKVLEEARKRVNSTPWMKSSTPARNSK